MITDDTFTGSTRLVIRDRNGQTLFSLPQAHEVYDALMGSIEPELLSGNLPQLEHWHENETEAEKKERHQRYERAFAIYEERFAAWLHQFQAACLAFRKAAFQSAENDAQQEDAGNLAHLASQFR